MPSRTPETKQTKKPRFTPPPDANEQDDDEAEESTSSPKQTAKNAAEPEAEEQSFDDWMEHGDL